MSCASVGSRIQELISLLPRSAPSRADGGIDVPDVVAELAQAWPAPLDQSHRRALDAICRKIAVTGTLLARYDQDWKTPTTKTPLTTDQWCGVMATLAAWSDVLEGDPASYGLSLKLLNAVLAAMDRHPAGVEMQSWIDEHLEHINIPTVTSAPAERIVATHVCGQALPLWCRHLACIPPQAGSLHHKTRNSPTENGPGNHAPRTLPLTVLAYEGPCARAYLAMMRRAGLRPERIILVVLNEHPSSHKPVGRWFPGRLRAWYAEKTQDLALNYWPRRIRSSHPELVAAIASGLEPLIDRPVELISEMYGPRQYEAYADTVERVGAARLDDPAVCDALKSAAPASILFTGGGILPSRIIDLPGLRFLHVHPGCLPHVRGADGLLWSMLVRGRPAMSCFYLANGLDTGDVIATHQYPPLAFGLAQMPTRPDDQTLYRALFGFVDPLLRADLLVNGVLATGGHPAALSTTPQDEHDGVTYHFMHPALRKHVLPSLFQSHGGPSIWA